MSSEIPVKIDPKTLEGEIRDKLTVVYGWGQLIDEYDYRLRKKVLLSGQGAIKRATVNLTELFALCNRDAFSQTPASRRLYFSTYTAFFVPPDFLTKPF